MTSLTAAAPPTTSTTTATVALVGNPNTGKTALFNRLTGARQRVANYPGVTVEKKLGTLRLPRGDLSVIDLPGAYSLAALSADERIVIDVLTGRMTGTARPDLVVCVVDATNLLRNLFLASQIADTGLPIVIALNMWDAALDRGIHIEVDYLSRQLGVPVVPTVAHQGRGIDQLRQAIADALDTQPCMATVDWPDDVTGAAKQIQREVQRSPGQAISQAEAMRLLFDAESAIGDRLGWPNAEQEQVITAARQRLREAGHDPLQVESSLRYHWLGRRLEQIVTFPRRRRATHTESIDNLLTHRFWGLIVFTGVMYAVFWSIYTLAVPFMDGIEALFGLLGKAAGSLLEATPVLQALVTGGLIAGVGSVIVFLPQILLLFFFICLLEDTGYIARAAFLMDKMFSWCGLNGKSFVPMLGCYACAVPGIMGARTIEDSKARLTTILIAPLMSCSARLPVYVLLIGAFVEPQYGAGWAAFVLFFMHIFGLMLAIPIAFVLNRFVFRAKPVPFILEMPPYRVPRWSDVLWRMYQRGREFLLRAGTVIFAMSIIIWTMCYFPRPQSVEQQLVQDVAAAQAVSIESAQQMLNDSEGLQHRLEGRYLEQSIMGRLGKMAQPIFAPAGFDWKITVSVLGSFPAREVIIATLGIIYNLGGDVDEQNVDLITAMAGSTWPDGSPVFTLPVGLAVMVFFALCMQCSATLVVIARETSWKWAGFAFAYMTTLAWVAAVVTYQLGTAIMGPGV
ncbi:MAG: ferrous iron transport protein B [Phycisphaeraceae bacterium]